VVGGRKFLSMSFYSSLAYMFENHCFRAATVYKGEMIIVYKQVSRTVLHLQLVRNTNTHAKKYTIGLVNVAIS